MTGGRMARIVAAVCAGLVTLASTACGGEIVHPNSADLPGARSGSTAADVGTACRRYGVGDAPKLLLGTHDVWPEGGNLIESYVDLQFDSRGCADSAPPPGIYDCAAGFPWFNDIDLAENLGFIGVVEMRSAMITNLDVPTDPTVTETLLTLGPGAASILDHVATACDAAPVPDPSGIAYEMAGEAGQIGLLLVIQVGGAVAVSFPDGSGLPDIRKRAIFRQAVGLAGL